ncbi:MAG: hypothetical protein UY05_C0011G0008 [Candidatus Peregrinibacteria bacterium GW2011_GWA2_47_7]|nr:MAG: hypothetical protein UY05_C0011G0008 [Candidatus Peregrinibacteria bacterium GW2011_GWA2_47_7]
MVTAFIFTKYAKRKFTKLPLGIQKRIVVKLTALKKHEDIFSILRPLHNFEPATHRLRIGSYRLILELKADKKSAPEFLILDMGHRRDIYR